MNICLSEAGTPGARAEIKKWYNRFSRAEEVIDEVGWRPHPEPEVRSAVVALKRLTVEGKRLAARIGATLRVDYGHDPSLKGLELAVLGEDNGDVAEWWERQEELFDASSKTRSPGRAAPASGAGRSSRSHAQPRAPSVKSSPTMLPPESDARRTARRGGSGCG